MKHLTKESLDNEAKKIAEIIQFKVFDSIEKNTEENHKKIYSFLAGASYGLFLLMKYIERGIEQPYSKFIEEELEGFKRDIGFVDAEVKDEKE